MCLLRMEYAIYSDKAVLANFSPLLLKRSFFMLHSNLG